MDPQGICVDLQGARGVPWYRVGDGCWVFEGILGGSLEPQVGSRGFRGGLRDSRRFWSWR